MEEEQASLATVGPTLLPLTFWEQEVAWGFLFDDLAFAIYRKVAPNESPLHRQRKWINKSHKIHTEKYLTLAMEIAPNVIESQQSKIPEVLNVTGNITVHGLMNTMSSFVSAPEAGRKALLGEQKPVQDGDFTAEGFLELLP
ncbi:hypothetical protein BTVI_55349 [Pitangus sulphuratus]|nr:hypothetical protein BTVI_55349 [Pitangus sulphuratus]